MTGPWRLGRLARILATGGIVAHPTEGVFGLACDPLNARALARTIALKRRDGAKGLIVIGAATEHLAGLAHADDLVRLPATERATTWVVRAGPLAPRLVTGGRCTIAVRLCSHRPTAALCHAFGRAVVSTSANRSGSPPVQSALGVRLRFGVSVDGVMGDAVGGARRPSRIVELASGRVLRD